MADAETTHVFMNGVPAGTLSYDVPEGVVLRVNNLQTREVFRAPAGVNPLAYAAARIAQLERENAALRVALEAEWRIAHAEPRGGLSPSVPHGADGDCGVTS